jgi:hypothetical protein
MTLTLTTAQTIIVKTLDHAKQVNFKALGVSGDTSDNDEAAALAGIQAAGLVGDGG